MNYHFKLSYEDEEVREFECFAGLTKIGYYVENKETEECEVYHDPLYDDFTSIDIVENDSEAQELIIFSYELQIGKIEV